jgi:adenine-specific DNA-methyltransferase
MSGEPEPELTWTGKHDRVPPGPCCLVEEVKRCYRGRQPGLCDNRLIFGDNLPVLCALQPEFAGQVKCVYIDPPYNTGANLKHYDDGLEHGRWLSSLRDRLELLRTLLRPDGVLFVSIDETELGYLLVLLDGVFGRSNGCGLFVWERKKKPSFLNAQLGVVTEYIAAYARDRSQAPPFVGGRTTPGKMYPLNNAGNGRRILTFPAGAVCFRCPDQVFVPQDMSAGDIVTVLLDPVEVRAGRNVAPFRLDGEWRYSQATLEKVIAAGGQLVISKAPFRPNHIRPGGTPKKLRNLLSIASGMATYEDATTESRALFGAEHAFDYPKPEKLMATLVGAVTAAGDWVLDAFAGSGSTGAVAHKLGRRWILVEQGEHCHTHIIPRIGKVIDGRDPGGVTMAAGWQGGGGFRYFRLATR